VRIKTLTLKGFKRFDDLTIDLGNQPSKIIALVGPNGSGKSSVFDAFEEKQKDYKGANVNESIEFFSKFLFNSDEAIKSQQYQKNLAIKITTTDDNPKFDKKSFYIRSAYRFTPKLNVTSITAQPDILDDTTRPTSSIAVDSRFQQDYERLLGQAYDEWETGQLSGPDFRTKLLGHINGILRNILDIQISNMGNVRAGKGQLYFDKEDAKSFPYQNLSSGEKEVVNIILDIYVKARDFDNTVYCIDEPELHLNTAIQRKLLVEIERLIPENCQLWVATHSIGFLRALQDELNEKCSVLDFSEKNYFRGTHTITPMPKTRTNWQRIFGTALDDLAGLIAPRRIIYCEGKQESNPNGGEQGLDAAVYNEIFKIAYPDTLFISSGGTNDLPKYSGLAIRILSKAFLDVELLLLCDRDENSDDGRNTFLSQATHHRMLGRREIENYIFDLSILKDYCAQHERVLNESDCACIVNDIYMQDLRQRNTLRQLKDLCGFENNLNEFKKELALHVSVNESIYLELEHCIFNKAMP
jgi:predicted ATPase